LFNDAVQKQKPKPIPLLQTSQRNYHMQKRSGRDKLLDGVVFQLI
jgi:hypothetical protein